MKLLYIVFSVLMATVGYHIHESIFWTVMDFFFTPFALIKWIVYHEVTLSVLKATFAWFFV